MAPTLTWTPLYRSRLLALATVRAKKWSHWPYSENAPVILQDNFDRVAGPSSWGSPTSGPAWKTGVYLTCDGARGLMTFPAITNGTSAQITNLTPSLDLEVSGSVSIPVPTASLAEAAIYLRGGTNAFNDAIRFNIRHLSTGVWNIGATTYANAVLHTVVPQAMVADVTDTMSFRIRCLGTKYSVKGWETGTEEPEAWTAEGTDPGPQPAAKGTLLLFSSWPASATGATGWVVAWDDLTITDLTRRIKDIGTAGMHLSPFGSVTAIPSAGGSGGAASFTRTQAYLLGNPPGPLMNKSETILGLVQWVDDAANWQRIAQLSGSGTSVVDNGWMLQVNPATGTIALAGYTAGAYVIGANTPTTPNLLDSKWHHFAFVVTPQAITGYMDGIAGPPSGSARWANGVAGIMVGSYQAGGGWKGGIDEMSYLDVALTDSEIKMLAQSFQSSVNTPVTRANRAPGATVYPPAQEFRTTRADNVPVK